MSHPELGFTSEEPEPPQSDAPVCEPFLNEAELAKLLRCSPRTVQNHRQRGRGPAYFKVGNLVRYRVSDIQSWLTSRAVAADSLRQPAA